MLTADQLQKFCSDDITRPYIMKPFTRGEHTWATNGHIMIRVPKIDGIEELGGLPPVEKPWGIADWSLPLRPLKFGKLPPVEDEEGDCELCEGRGTEHDCPGCPCVCENCHGSGLDKWISDDEKSLSIGNAIFSARYIRELSELPRVQIPSDPHTENPMPFKFDGGEGLLMPMRREYDDHLDIEV